MKQNKKIINIVAIALVCILGIVLPISKMAYGENPKAEMILFYSPSCPHCHHAMEFLEKIEPKYKDLKITRHNTSTTAGANYYFHYKKKLNIDGNGVPLAIFGDKYELGYGSDDTTGKQYIEYIEEMLKQ